MTWITVDPGLSGTGWAVWGHRRLIASGSIRGLKNAEWYESAAHIANEVTTISVHHGCDKAYYELPQFIQGRYEVNASGDLVKLTICAGMIAGRLAAYALVKPIRIIDWKGNLPKDLCIARVKLALSARGAKLSTSTSHEADAVGIGLYLTGDL